MDLSVISTVSFTPPQYGKNSTLNVDDSGYHTFTPGSTINSSKAIYFSDSTGKANFNTPVSRRGLKRPYEDTSDFIDITPPRSWKCSRESPVDSDGVPDFITDLNNSCFLPDITPPGSRDISPSRRGTLLFTPKATSDVKYPLQQNLNNYQPTPTSIIVRSLKALHFNDYNSSLLADESSFNYSGSFCTPLKSYPSTPRKCRSNCKSLKENFTIHSLSCDLHIKGDKKIIHKPEPLFRPIYKYKPNQKIDIINLLFAKAKVMPAIRNIFNYLSFKDISNFRIVNRVWLDVSKVMRMEKSQKGKCKGVVWEKENVRKDSPLKTLENNKLLNDIRKNEPAVRVLFNSRPLREVQSKEQVLNDHIKTPGSPGTIRFRKYTQSLSMENPITQEPCFRCLQPAIVHSENNETWCQCNSLSCSYQYCKFCKCNRHPGKSCDKFNLDGPSPSKRRKNTCIVGSKKSRRNLHRLL